MQLSDLMNKTMDESETFDIYVPDLDNLNPLGVEVEEGFPKDYFIISGVEVKELIPNIASEEDGIPVYLETENTYREIGSVRKCFNSLYKLMVRTRNLTIKAFIDGEEDEIENLAVLYMMR